MPHRYHQERASAPVTSLRRAKLFHAVREKLAEGYRLTDLKADMMAGVVVGMVAIPLGMALAIASGVAPQHGLYTVVIGGIVVALLGGSRFQVSGPTAAFVVILAPIAARHGVAGLLTAGMMSGMILLVMGYVRLGRFMQFIPYPVTTGFTAGIALVIATLQCRDFFGLQVTAMPERFLDKVVVLIHAAPTASWLEFGIGGGTLLLLWWWPKITRKIPAPLVVMCGVSVLTAGLTALYPELSIATIGSRFSYDIGGMTGHGIPHMLHHITWPWLHGAIPFTLSLQSIEALVPSAFAIAMLGAVESLLSAVVADGMAHTKHDPDTELMALGVGNILCPFFGGIAATGAIARTATNIRFGARSPFSAIIHGVFALLVILLCAPYVSYLPMASLSALLILVAYNMCDRKHFAHILKVGPASDVGVLMICFLLTVVFDMVIGVTAGVLLAAVLFMQRMAATTTSRILESQQQVKHYQVPPDVLLYDINGPLFFGAAETAMEAIDSIQDNVRTVFLLMEDVPVMDVTGLVALESTVDDLVCHRRTVYLVGVNPQPRALMLKSDAIAQAKNLFFCTSVHDAIQHHQGV